MKTVYSIGHSTRSIDTFIAILKSFDIRILADVRSFPGSKRHPQFNRQSFEKALAEVDVKYIHMPVLGGKLQHTGGYIAYMETLQFKQGITELEQHAGDNKLAYMCAEASWRNCHRAHISAWLHKAGWQVQHITGFAKAELHPGESSKPQQGNLFTAE
jgi:uncharacterized protein (DUF488 family)